MAKVGKDLEYHSSNPPAIDKEATHFNRLLRASSNLVLKSANLVI